MNRNRSICMGALLTCALVVLGTLGLGTSRAASHSLGMIASPAPQAMTSTTAAPLDINTATKDQLTALPGIGDGMAATTFISAFALRSTIETT